LDPNPRFYINDSGTGNTLALEHPRVLQLVMDSLRFWVSEMQVDGYRFDLASILGREKHGFDRGAGFFDAITQDPVLADTRLIAEPWDLGPGGYQLGQYPVQWAEWNDQFRDGMINSEMSLADSGIQMISCYLNFLTSYLEAVRCLSGKENHRLQASTSSQHMTDLRFTI